MQTVASKEKKESTYIIMTEHDSFGLACGARGVDESAALVWLLAGDDSVEWPIGLIESKRHEFIPLEKVCKGHFE